jgi:hypothetical protein
MFWPDMNQLLSVERTGRRYRKPPCDSQVPRSEIAVPLAHEFALSFSLVLSSLALLLSCLASRHATKTLYI